MTRNAPAWSLREERSKRSGVAGKFIARDERRIVNRPEREPAAWIGVNFVARNHVSVQVWLAISPRLVVQFLRAVMGVQRTPDAKDVGPICRRFVGG